MDRKSRVRRAVAGDPSAYSTPNLYAASEGWQCGPKGNHPAGHISGILRIVLVSLEAKRMVSINLLAIMKQPRIPTNPRCDETTAAMEEGNAFELLVIPHTEPRMRTGDSPYA